MIEAAHERAYHQPLEDGAFPLVRDIQRNKRGVIDRVCVMALDHGIDDAGVDVLAGIVHYYFECIEDLATAVEVNYRWVTRREDEIEGLKGALVELREERDEAIRQRDEARTLINDIRWATYQFWRADYEYPSDARGRRKWVMPD